MRPRVPCGDLEGPLHVPLNTKSLRNHHELGIGCLYTALGRLRRPQCVSEHRSTVRVFRPPARSLRSAKPDSLACGCERVREVRDLGARSGREGGIEMLNWEGRGPGRSCRPSRSPEVNGSSNRSSNLQCENARGRERRGHVRRRGEFELCGQQARGMGAWTA